MAPSRAAAPDATRPGGGRSGRGSRRGGECCRRDARCGRSGGGALLAAGGAQQVAAAASAVLGMQMPAFALAVSNIVAVFYNPDVNYMKSEVSKWCWVFAAAGFGMSCCPCSSTYWPYLQSGPPPLFITSVHHYFVFPSPLLFLFLSPRATLCFPLSLALSPRCVCNCLCACVCVCRCVCM